MTGVLAGWKREKKGVCVQQPQQQPISHLQTARPRISGQREVCLRHVGPASAAGGVHPAGKALAGPPRLAAPGRRRATTAGSPGSRRRAVRTSSPAEPPCQPGNHSFSPKEGRETSPSPPPGLRTGAFQPEPSCPFSATRPTLPDGLGTDCQNKSTSKFPQRSPCTRAIVRAQRHASVQRPRQCRLRARTNGDFTDPPSGGCGWAACQGAPPRPPPCGSGPQACPGHRQMPA